MTPAIKVAEAKPYLRVTAHGKHTVEAAREALALIAEHRRTGSTSLLIDVREAASYLLLPEIRVIADEFVRLQIASGNRTAILCTQERYDNVQFFAVSARTMGCDVQAFTSFEDAVDWLTL